MIHPGHHERARAFLILIQDERGDHLIISGEESPTIDNRTADATCIVSASGSTYDEAARKIRALIADAAERLRLFPSIPY